MSDFFVYILASPSRTLSIGVTNDVERRVWEPKHKIFPGFTSKYSVDRLVFHEEFSRADDVIAREKQLTGWTRAKKIALIETENPKWYDFSYDWYSV